MSVIFHFASVVATLLVKAIRIIVHWPASSIGSIMHHPWCHVFDFSIPIFLSLKVGRQVHSVVERRPMVHLASPL